MADFLRDQPLPLVKRNFISLWVPEHHVHAQEKLLKELPAQKLQEGLKWSISCFFRSPSNICGLSFPT